MRLWYVGRFREQVNGEEFRCVWEFQGVFSTEEKAVAACRDHTYFVVPIELDQELAHETVEPAGCYYPIPCPT